jgi:hypothetical protein
MARKTTDTKSKRNARVKALPKPKVELTSKQAKKVRGGQSDGRIKYDDIVLKRG